MGGGCTASNVGSEVTFRQAPGTPTSTSTREVLLGCNSYVLRPQDGFLRAKRYRSKRAEMRRIHHELEAGAVILAILDRRRAETGDPALGSAIERVILNRCLSDLDEPARIPVTPGDDRAEP